MGVAGLLPSRPTSTPVLKARGTQCAHQCGLHKHNAPSQGPKEAGDTHREHPPPTGEVFRAPCCLRDEKWPERGFPLGRDAPPFRAVG